MRILINTASTHKGGGVQVARSFIEECKKYVEHEYHIVLGEMLANLIEQNSFPKNFSFYNIGFRPATRVLSLKSRDNFFGDLERKINPDAVFTTSGPAYWRPNAPHLIGYNLPHYIYRDSPFFSQISLLKRMKWDTKGYLVKRFFKKDADAYVVQTEDVNMRLKKLLNVEKVYTVSNTISHYYLNPQKVADKLPAKEKDEFRLLILSAWYPHKNLEVIPEVIDAIPANLQEGVRFVLTLPDHIFQNQFPQKYHRTIVNVGPIRPEDGPSLYKECDALFLPTLLECFSASYVEAMAMKKPILTSDLGFARSICGQAALYFDPINPIDISIKIKELTEKKELRKELVKKGLNQLNIFLSAEERARQYLNICNQLSSGRKK